MPDKYVLLINPPMSLGDEKNNEIVDEVFSGDLPALGILALASAIEDIEGIKPVYLDGNVCSFKTILSFIENFNNNILCIGISALSENYYIGLKILKFSRSLNNKIIHVIGNEHFTALPHLCLENQQHLLDYGFYGNDVVYKFKKFIYNLLCNQDVRNTPSLVYYHNNKLFRNPEVKESLPYEINYRLLDSYYPHTKIYERNFDSARLERWFNRKFNRSTIIEIARGCVKFKNNNKCSFCSIQYGNIWKNSISNGKEAWSFIEKTFRNGYDVIFITADELLLTFYSLLIDMRNNMPDWFKALSEFEKPLLIAYVRVEGLCNERNVKLLYDLGVRIVYLGIDAGSKFSINIFNKSLYKKEKGVERLYEQNKRALDVVKKLNMKVDIGYVLGHIGLTKGILQENIDFACELISNYSNTIGVFDANILCPEPGSRDYYFLINPVIAMEFAKK
ncbi:MAG: cobalamin-dependent protein, partial [Flavobacteriales bacterium]|nr:cobalamin-dependent protein [Flavobacteriales bacterium]